MQKWKPNPEVIKNDRYKSAEIAYIEIQKYCRAKGYMFFFRYDRRRICGGI